ncbi:hypothetical protein T484DRAFT_1822982 [Baffinella frigidus]|nr:hypothetical protein T484DRAFT_1822982 [Cryptophyta sp. CCMP2293]
MRLRVLKRLMIEWVRELTQTTLNKFKRDLVIQRRQAEFKRDLVIQRRPAERDPVIQRGQAEVTAPPAGS